MSPDATPNPQPAPAPATQPPPLPQTPQPAPNWEPLSPLERRILGVLIEKQKTARSSEAYPLTLNSLVTGCNQKTNRDPVLDLSDDEVEEGLTSLQKKQLVMRMTGGRAEKFRHLLYEKWTPNGPEMAVIAELFLRGPQTKGDLRGRAGRMDPIETLDALEEILKSLGARRLAVYLTEPDRRGAVVTHGFHAAQELTQLRAHHANAPASASVGFDSPAPARPAPLGVSPDTIAALESKLAAAVAEIDSLKGQVAVLTTAVADIRSQLGLPRADA